jgi:hypothetical protein
VAISGPHKVTKKLDTNALKKKQILEREDSIMRSFITYASPNIIMVIKSRRIRWTGHVARIGEMKYA